MTIQSTGGGDLGSTGGSMSTGGSASTGSGYTGSTGGSTGAGTFISSTGGSTGTTPEYDWRKVMAGDDQQELARLGRFASAADVYRSFRELERRMSSGQLKSVLGKDAKPEEVTAWRKENGIPETPEAYMAQIQFENGLTIGEEDKPAVQELLKRAHANNFTPAQAKAGIEFMLEQRGRQDEARQEKDQELITTATEALREKWGPEFKANKGAVQSLLKQTPPVKLPDGTTVPLGELLIASRLPDGTPVGSSVEAVEWLAYMARQLNPAATVVPGAGANAGKAIEEELAGLKKMMGNRKSEYWVGPKAEGHQARYRQLLEAQEQMKKRGATVA